MQALVDWVATHLMKISWHAAFHILNSQTVDEPLKNPLNINWYSGNFVVYIYSVIVILYRFDSDDPKYQHPIKLNRVDDSAVKPHISYTSVVTDGQWLPADVAHFLSCCISMGN